MNEPLTVWAIAYEHYYYWSRIGPVPVNCSGTGVCEGNLSGETGSSTTFTPGTLGTGTIFADTPFVSCTPDATATINVVPEADLVVDDIQLSSLEAQSGEVIEVTWTVSNQGPEDLSGTLRDCVYLSSDDQLGNDTRIGIFTYADNMPAGTHRERAEEVSLPNCIEGDFSIIVKTDCNNNVYEYEGEDNNVLVDDQVLQVVLTPHPDLVVTDITVPVEAPSGQPVEISWTVTNNGEGEATGTWRDRIYLSSDDQWGSNDTYLAVYTYSGNLAANTNYQRTEEIDIPNCVEGDFYIIAVTDYNNNFN